jgi:hypothetical protein
MLNSGKNITWNRDEPAVVAIASEFAVRRYFRSVINNDEIAAFVADIRERVRSSAPPGQSETEAVVRRALGDSSVAMPRVSAEELCYIQGLVLGQVVFRLELSQPEINRLIERVERQAFNRGWKPPLYTEENLP